jgi:hypothetical protein
MGFIFFLLVVGAIIYASIKTSQAAREKWRAAGQSLQLSYDEGTLGSVGSLSGFIHGHAVHVTTFTRGSGKSSQTYTRYTVSYCDPLPLNFTISRQKTMHSLGKAFGMQDIEIGDEAFDEEVLVQGSNPDGIRRLLNQDLREDILDLFLFYPATVITYDCIQVEKRGKDTESEIITQCVRKLVEFCNEISDLEEGNSAPVAPVPVAEQAFQNPVVVLPTQKVSESEETLPDPIEVIVEHQEDLSEQIADPAEQEIPIDVMEEQVVVVDRPEVTEEAVAAPLNIQEVAEGLFGRDSGGTLQQSKNFKEQFEGRFVQGEGTLTRVDKFNYDMVFKNCTGVKATLEICTLEDAYSKLKIAAVVKYPPEEYERLSERKDETLPIMGKLIGLDALMHQLYVDGNPGAESVHSC